MATPAAVTASMDFVIAAFAVATFALPRAANILNGTLLVAQAIKIVAQTCMWWFADRDMRKLKQHAEDLKKEVERLQRMVEDIGRQNQRILAAGQSNASADASAMHDLLVAGQSNASAIHGLLVAGQSDIVTAVNGLSDRLDRAVSCCGSNQK